MKKNNLVLVISKNDKTIELTRKNIQKYSKKINSDYHEIISEDDWSKCELYDLLNTYKRIIYFNANVIIREDTPSLFDIVPDNELGMFDEGRYTVQVDKIKNASSIYDINLDSWNGSFYNTGVMVVSRIHKQLFKPPKVKKTNFTDYFNLEIFKNKIKVFDINYNFNRMHFVDKFIGITRLDSKIIHYQDAPEELLYKTIIEDLDAWKKASPNYTYKRNIAISVSAGMGDQICAEPAIRFTQNMYPNDNFYIITHFPRLFQHLKIPTYTHGEWKGLEDAVLLLHTCPEYDISEHKLSHVFFYPTDYSSMSMIKRNIPNHEKTIKLQLLPEDTKTVYNLLSSKKTNKPTVVVHPGKWWPSKTFPIDWWQEVVNKLSEKLTVVLIGKTISEEQGYLPIECPEDGIDLRDLTTLGELMSLISLSKVTLSNDSSPIHIAGAFDNWIVVIPTAKHPDHILPFRNGSQYYKTKSLCKKLLLDDLEVKHTSPNPDTIDMLPKGKSIIEYLPEVDVVVKEVLEIYENEN